ncbi:hypothetical protein CDAR_496871 [Caerostris darwini]|uniref:Uncharacterized protein n=1 Tax=Caerostris darwini TaxID=1538125 RepID=A0AAV4U586_9ARAC|nr:hypothetical protein CDAR_496871 [Caerostris darwini]
MAPEPLAQLCLGEIDCNCGEARVGRRGRHKKQKEQQEEVKNATHPPSKHGASGEQGAALSGQLSHLRSMPNGPAEVEIFKLIDPFRFLTDWIVSPLLPRLADSHLRGMSSAFNYLRPYPLLSLPYHPLRSIHDCRQAVNTELLSGVGVEVVSIH